ncbi:MAG: AAA family ATPase [Pseudomonadota bacterium]|nr:AAA family ATPase [Pseudomonadota bacterium]
MTGSNAAVLSSATVLSISNQKGGVGKTTTSINLVASLAQLKHRVLLIDLDPQGNASTGCGLDKNELEISVYDVLVGDATMQEAIVSTAFDFDVLPANGDLTAASVELLNQPRKEYILKTALAPILDQYDFIIIDCPPSLSMLTVNALVASDQVLVPIQCEYYALEGLSDLLDTIRQVSGSINPTLSVGGIVRTMYDMRNSLANDVSAQLLKHFRDGVFRTIIPRNVRLAESPSHGEPVWVYDRSSRGAIAYMALAKELVARQKEAR